MVSDPYIQRIAGGGLLILSGLLCKALQARTRIPDVFFLMLVGVLSGPVLHVANAANYQPLILLFTSLALAFLMFWVGSQFRVKNLFKGFGTNLLFTFLAYTLTFILSFSLAQFFGLPFFSALLIAILMSDTGPTIVNSVANSLKLTSSGKTGMIIESGVSNSFGLGLFLGTYLFAQQGAIEWSAAAFSVLHTFLLAIALGAVFGLIWILFLRGLKFAETFTWATLAGLLLLYAVVEHLQAAAPIAAFVFGFMVANAEYLDKKLGLQPRKLPFSHSLQDHILFFIRTAFFVYMGLLFPLDAINVTLVLFVVAAMICIGILRTALVFLMPQAFTFKDVIAQAYVYPTGFSVVILTFLPALNGFTVPFLTEAIFYAVMVSNLISAVATRLHRHPTLLKALAPAFGKN